MSTMTTSRRAAGFTLVEVAIASMIMGVLILAVFAVLASGTSQSQSMTAGLNSDTRIRGFLQTFSDDFQASGSIVIPEDPLPSGHRLFKPNSFNKVAFGIQTGFTTGKTFSTEYLQRVEYSWELSDRESDPLGSGTALGIDGVDSDLNGLIDDGQIRRQVFDNTDPKNPELLIENTVVLRDVTYRGFFVEYVAGAQNLNDITLNLEAFAIDPNKKQKDPNSSALLPGHSTRLTVQRVSRRRV